MKEELNGVSVDTEEFELAEVTRVKVTNAEGAAKIGRPIGETVTVAAECLRYDDEDDNIDVALILANELRRLILSATGELDSVLVVGLGNAEMPVDALGARTIRKIFTTNHIMDKVAEHGESDRMRPVLTFLPGVKGHNGFPTAEAIKGVCDRVKPALVILIDSLAATTIDNLYTIIQINTTGIMPGAANENCGESAINAEFLGVPVICIGVSVVIDVVTLVNDVIGLALLSETRLNKDFIANIAKSAPGKGKSRKINMRKTLNDDYGLNFVVPKEIDLRIDALSAVIAGALNMALHKGPPADNLKDANRH